MSTAADTRYDRDRTLPAGGVSLLGLVLGAATLQYLLTHPDPPVWWRLEIAATVVLSAAVVYTGRRLAKSEYTAPDLWGILGWALAGAAAAAAAFGVFYLHQTIEHAPTADPAFLVEFLSLVGLGAGVAVGIRHRSRSGRRIGTALESVDSTDIDGLRTVLSFLDGETRPIRQRLAVLEVLAGASTRELPEAVLPVRLAAAGGFPDDRGEIERLLREEHLPELTDAGLLERREDRGTVAYVGPEPLARHLGGR